MSRSKALPLSALPPGSAGRVARVTRDLMGRAERLAALGVSPGASVRVLQTFPGIVFECDQTELAIERAVARSILVHVDGSPELSGDARSTTKDTKDDKPRNLSRASFLRLLFRGPSCREAV